MKLHFLGGADEIGASCLLVETGHRRILVDGGIRMGGAAGDRLPDLSRATELGGVDAILLTHAHLDHSGALPLISGAFPKAEIWATEPTCGLLRILLLDAVKIMAKKQQVEQELPLYPLPAVEGLLARTNPARFYEPTELCDGDIRATFFPAGHVLGAAAVGIESKEGALLVTGDVSVGPQRTVPGMQVPQFRPDAVVCESTYGERLHASRKAEEQRLASTVVEAIRDEKRVLIPAFALGRAQEVILILRSVLARDDVDDFPVWVDGMVRAICGTYHQYSPYLSRRLQRKAEGQGELFYGAGGCVRPVTSPEQREEIASGPPCVVISSSGMLSGGPSTFFAERWCGREDAVLCITGYQDEEAPGRRLQEVARGGAAELNLQGNVVPIRCGVGTYALSAHADSRELTSMMAALDPRRVFLVHGDGDARRALSETMADSGIDVYLPEGGESVELHPEGSQTASGGRPRPPRGRDRRTAGPRLPGIGRRIGKDTGQALGKAPDLDAETVTELHRWCFDKSGPRRPWSVAELAAVWYGTDNMPKDLEPFRKVLWEAQPLFHPDPKRPFHFRAADPDTVDLPQIGQEPRDEAGRLEQNTALAFAQELLSGDSTFYKAGADRASWTLRLGFHFPDVAIQRHEAEIERIRTHTGWEVELSREPHLHALARRVQEVVDGHHSADHAGAPQAPSVHKDDRLVEVRVTSLPSRADRDEMSRLLEEQTGFRLRFKKVSSTPKAKKSFDSSGRMEINLTYGEVDRAFAQAHHTPRKKSKKRHGDREVVEVSFISPEVGRRYEPVLRDLEQRTGWPFRIAQKVDQGAVLTIARDLIPDHWSLKKNPGLDLAASQVIVKLREPVSETEIREVARHLEEKSGFSLEIRV